MSEQLKQINDQNKEQAKRKNKLMNKHVAASLFDSNLFFFFLAHQLSF